MLWTQLAIVRNSFVFATRNEIEQVFLKIRTGAGDGMHFVTANHLGERNTQFGGAHRTGQGNHHLSATIEMRHVGVGCVFQHRRVEMPKMALNELSDAAHLYITSFAMGTITLDAKLTVRGSSVNCILFKISYGIAARMRDAKTFGITPSKTIAAARTVIVAPCKEADRVRSIGSATAGDEASTKIAFNTRR